MNQEQPARLRDFSESLPMLLLNAHQQVMAQFRPLLRAHGITEQQWRVLRALDSANTPMTLAALSAATLIKAPSMTRIVRSLTKADLVSRTGRIDDLRVVNLAITRRGLNLIATVAPHSERQYQRIADAIGGHRLKALTRELSLLTDSLPSE